MPKTRFKICVADDGTQVLFEKGFDEETEKDAFIISFYTDDDVKAISKIIVNDGGNIDDLFDMSGEEAATLFVEHVKEVIEKAKAEGDD